MSEIEAEAKVERAENLGMGLERSYVRLVTIQHLSTLGAEMGSSSTAASMILVFPFPWDAVADNRECWMYQSSCQYVISAAPDGAQA